MPIAKSQVRWLLAGLVALVLLVLPHQVNFLYVHQAQTLALYVIVAAGLAVAVSYTGLISVGHAAIMGTGAYGAAYLATRFDLSFLVALTGGVLAAALVGLVVAIPTGRLKNFYFAMVTLGLGLVFEQMLIEWDWTGGPGGIYGIPRPELFGWSLSPTAFYYVTILTTVVVLVLLINLVSTMFGRRFLLVRDDEVAATSLGIRPYTTKLSAFVISSIPAGIAGVLFAYLNNVVTPGSFRLHLGLFFLLAVVVGGHNSIAGPIGGVLLLFAIPQYLREYRAWTNIIFGIVLLIVLAIEPGGMAEAGRRLRERWRTRREGGARAGGELLVREDRELPAFVTATQERSLTATDIDKSFGGVQALRNLSISIPPGQVSAIIGPNGSGKTTLLNILSGFYRHDTGTVHIGGDELPAHPSSVARAGIGRTFQTPKILDDHTVLDNVMAGYASVGGVTVFEAAVRLPRARAHEEVARARAMALLEYVGLAGREHEIAGDLPHPHLRFIEIARSLMTLPQFLLLDEPAAGLSHDEVRLLDRLVRDLAARGFAVVVVEHNIGLVMDIADTVLVLDSGEIVTSGEPAVVQGMPEVARVYLGDDWAEDATDAAFNPTPGSEPDPAEASPTN